MPRKPEAPGKPATERITFRLNADMLGYIDKARRKSTRAAYLRRLIREDAVRAREGILRSK